MAIANGAQHSLHFIAESTYGTTPSTPTWTPLPHTGATLALSKDGIESEKLRGDRQVEDFRHDEILMCRRDFFVPHLNLSLTSNDKLAVAVV